MAWTDRSQGLIGDVMRRCSEVAWTDRSQGLIGDVMRRCRLRWHGQIDHKG